MRTYKVIAYPLTLATLGLLILILFVSSNEVGFASAILEEPQANGPVLEILYRFSGATDDGEQGSVSRREATSIHCTNVDPSENAQVEVQVYQWNGTDVYTGTVNMPPNRTFTFSTQNTTIYFEDVLLGGSPGTEAIFQGSGQVLTSHPRVICTAEVLDPLNYPPTFVLTLPLYDSAGNLIVRNRPQSDLALVKEASPAIAGPGDLVQYTLTYSNLGVVRAENVVITDGITTSALSGLSFSSSGAVITPTGTTPYVWQVTDLFPGQGGVITVTGTVDVLLTSSDFAVNNTATIKATEDLTSTNNTSSAQVQVQIPRQHLPIIRR